MITVNSFPIIQTSIIMIQIITQPFIPLPRSSSIHFTRLIPSLSSDDGLSVGRNIIFEDVA